ncbi:Hpt domain-containing protein, partial [Pseudomonas sp. Pseusp97]|uniref:Hpt domain-containing protein n=1 Tax=Pseudomonas sp. Pseusp97 TaxID=3243065 RepID=UPI0039A41A90
MSFDADDEILQDFLVEAGEILEQLSEQLVELESRPDDMDLLNAIFRGFHTVKGGAGFLQLNALVECCHIAENVFDMLRKGERRVDAELMDVMLQALDTVNVMFQQVRDAQEPTPATPELLAALSRLADPNAAPAEAPAAAVAEPVAVEAPAAADAGAYGDITDAEFEQLMDALEPAAEAPAAPVGSGGDDITDDEFEALLDQLHGKGQFSAGAKEPAKPAPAPAAETPAGGDEISDDEFEALLDQLHGKGQFTGAKEEVTAPVEAVAAKKAEEAPAAAGDDNITDDEFEKLLDELHGKGQFTGTKEEPAAAAKPAAQPAPAPAP